MRGGEEARDAYVVIVRSAGVAHAQTKLCSCKNAYIYILQVFTYFLTIKMTKGGFYNYYIIYH